MRPAWKARLKQVWPYATASTTVMFMASACLGAFIAWQAGANTVFEFVIAVIDPSLASLVLLLVCIVVPEVFLGTRFRLPHVLTLPTIYLVLISGMKNVTQSTSAGLRRFENSERFDTIWLQPVVLLVAWVLLVVVLSAIGAFSVQDPDVQ